MAGAPGGGTASEWSEAAASEWSAAAATTVGVTAANPMGGMTQAVAQGQPRRYIHHIGTMQAARQLQRGEALVAVTAEMTPGVTVAAAWTAVAMVAPRLATASVTTAPRRPSGSSVRRAEPSLSVEATAAPTLTRCTRASVRTDASPAAARLVTRAVCTATSAQSTSGRGGTAAMRAPSRSWTRRSWTSTAVPSTSVYGHSPVPSAGLRLVARCISATTCGLSTRSGGHSCASTVEARFPTSGACCGISGRCMLAQ